jgi:Flp pilus assembly protein TadB
MLSDHERRELDQIEDGLAGDRRLVDALARSGRAGRSWQVRALIGFGVFLLVVGIVTGGNGPLVLQGLLIGSAGLIWRWWCGKRAARAAGDPERSTPRPAGPPPD